MPQGLVILGSYVLAEEVFDLISDMPGYEVAAFIENFDRSRCGRELEGRPIIWIDDAAKYTQAHRAVCALSTTKRRAYCEQAAGMGFQFATIVHPTARISSRATLGEGTFISAMAAVATRTALGRCVFVNRGALIGHHTCIGDYCTIQPGANVAGLITMGEQSYVGMGAVVLERKKIGAGSVIAAGSVVVDDVPDHVQVMGVPARISKTGIEGK
jgi:sugar O-acyltransferase (sialic acid O-acetyltransferase NeuD family)